MLFSKHKNVENLSSSEASNYSLRKATKKIKRRHFSVPPIRGEDGGWARNVAAKASTNANHLADVFQRFPADVSPDRQKHIYLLHNTLFLTNVPIKHINVNDIKHVIKELKPNKASGFDLITAKFSKNCLMKL